MCNCPALLDALLDALPDALPDALQDSNQILKYPQISNVHGIMFTGKPLIKKFMQGNHQRWKSCITKIQYLCSKDQFTAGDVILIFHNGSTHRFPTTQYSCAITGMKRHLLPHDDAIFGLGLVQCFNHF